MRPDKGGVKLSGHTIIGAPIHGNQPLRSLLMDQTEQEVPFEDLADTQRLFKIRAADSEGHRSSASILINRMYATRGYVSNGLPEPTQAAAITLVATDRELTIGTISVGFDGPQGLLAEDSFQEEIDAMRAAGATLCEFTKLAMDSVVSSKRVLASLFHVAYIFAYRIQGCDHLLIEVNPRHVRYYERMFGFEIVGEKRMNRRVNAPAILLALEFARGHKKIAEFGGRPELSATERSLFPYFFSVGEEAGIVGRLQKQ